MAEQPRTKLTKAEAGRLGGLRTKQRHGRPHFQQAGRKGGRATVATHGKEHMAEIGRRGFSRLAGRIGCYRSRKAAVQFLQAQGRLSVFPIQAVVAALAAIPADPAAIDPDDPGRHDAPIIAAILVSIRSAPEGGSQP
jgi:general stress protein YciG